jgi:integrase/recombinase XerD
MSMSRSITRIGVSVGVQHVVVCDPVLASNAGVRLRDVQEAASHADQRTTMRYDRGRGSLDRHATHIVANFVAGASR